MREYDYRIVDSLAIRFPDRTIEVFQLSIRPKNDRAPRAVGAVFVEKSTAQVVRMTFSFTRVALKDQSLEDVSVILENGLIEDRYWLPRRQQIEIRRSGTWLDFPFRGIIRGRWEIRDYDVNTGLPGVLFGGDEIVMAPPDRQAAFRFEGEDAEINVLAPPGGHKPEFDAWRWEALDRTPALIVDFKRPVYQEVVKLFAGFSNSN